MKVAAITALAALAACAAAPAEPLLDPRPKRRPPEPDGASQLPLHQPPLVAFEPRPKISLQPIPPQQRNDPSELVRWPLSQGTHPSLEPSFPIAKVFAEPGVSWIDLCATGVQNRRGGGVAEEHRAYLTAWCEVLKHDARSAVARLAPLLSTLQRGVPDAVRRDVANIVVDAGTTDVAEDLLTRARIDDVPTYDLIAATYAEVGRLSEARYFNGRALAGSARAPSGTCERRAREILLAPAELRRELVMRFRRIGSCRELANDIACWNDARDCSRTDLETLHELYNSWPTRPSKAHTWFNLAYRSSLVLSVPGADELATIALRAMVEASHCHSNDIRLAVETAVQIRATRHHNLNLDPQLDQIIKTPENLCRP